MAVVTAKELIRKLRATGTGDAKLQIGREVLMKDPKASADTVVAAYKLAFEAGQIADLTWEKVQTIATKGDWVNPLTVKPENIEDEPDEPAPAISAPAPSAYSPPPSGPSTGGKGSAKAKGDDFADVK